MHSVRQNSFNGNFWKLLMSVKTGWAEKFQPSLDWKGSTRPGTYQERWDVSVCWLRQNEVPYTGLNNRNPEVLKTGSARLRCQVLLPLMSREGLSQAGRVRFWQFLG